MPPPLLSFRGMHIPSDPPNDRLPPPLTRNLTGGGAWSDPLDEPLDQPWLNPWMNPGSRTTDWRRTMPPKKLGTTTVTTTKTVQKGVKGADPCVQMNRAWKNVPNMTLGAAVAAVWTVKSIEYIAVAKFVPEFTQTV